LAGRPAPVAMGTAVVIRADERHAGEEGVIRAGDRPPAESSTPRSGAAVGAGEHVHVTEPLSRHKPRRRASRGVVRFTFDGSVGLLLRWPQQRRHDHR